MESTLKYYDFEYMHRGKAVRALPAEEMDLLKPIDNKGSGRNRALLLFHGFSSSPAVYRQLAPSLTMYDAIVCPLLPGHGDSIDAFSKVNATQWIECAEQTCEQLLNTYQSVDVLGLSLGGILALHLSHRFRIHHLFLLAPALSLCLNVHLTLFVTRLTYLLGVRYIPNKAGNIYTPGHPELSYRQLPLKAAIEILTLIKTFQWSPPTCPVDVFLGRYDEVVHSTKVAALFSQLPNAQIHWLENSAHVLPLDGDVNEIIACINGVNH